MAQKNILSATETPVEVVKNPAPTVTAASPAIVPVGPPPSKIATMPEFDRAHLESLTSVSNRIRYLNSMGLTNSQITKVMTNAKGQPLLYQHVRNVLKSPRPKSA